MADLSLSVDFLLNGADKVAALRRELDALKRSGSTAGRSGASPRSNTTAVERAAAKAKREAAQAAREAQLAIEREEKAIISRARAMATAQSQAGQTAQAQKTLASALARVNQETTAAIRAQGQLASINNKLRLESERAERAIIQQAQAEARLKQSQGDRVGAARALQNALAKVTPRTLAAGRAQKQLNDLTTDYANSPLISAIRSISGGFGRLVPGIGQVTNALSTGAGAAQGMTGGLTAAGVAAGVFVAAIVAVGVAILAAVKAGSLFIDFLQSVAAEGIKANAQLEQTRIGIATVLASVATVRDAKGIELKGIDALNAALPESERLLRILRVRGLETALSFEELSQGFLQALGPGLAGGLKGEEIVDTVVSLSQLVGPLTGQTQQLGQELRALLSGNINARSAQVATALGISGEDIKRAKEAGKLAEFLNEKLKVAAATGKILGQTFTAAKTNLAEAATIFASVVTENLFNTLRDKINQVLPQLFDPKSANLLAAGLAGVGDTLTLIFDSAGRLIGEVIDLAVAGVLKVSKFLDDNRQVVGEIVQTAEEILRTIGLIIGDMFGVTGGTETWSARIKTAADLLYVALSVIQLLRAQFRILVNAVTIVGAAIVSAILYPMSKAAQAIATVLSFVPGVGQAAQAAADAIQGLLNVATSSVKNSAAQLVTTISDVGTEALRASGRISQAGKRALNREKTQGKKTENKFPGATFTPAKQKEDEEEKKAKAQTGAQLFAIEKGYREARLALIRAESEKALAIARANDEAETSDLQRALDDRLISINDYYDRRIKIGEDAAKRDLINLRARLREEQDALRDIQTSGAEAVAQAKKPADKKKVELEQFKEEVQVKGRILDIETKIAELEIKSGSEVKALNNERIKQLRDLQVELESIEQQLLTATGRGFEASALQIAAQFRDLLKKTIREFGEDSAQVLAIKSLQAGLLAEAALRQAGENTSREQLKLDIEKANIQTDLNRGLINERQARQELLALERARRADLLKSLDVQLQIAEKLYGPNSSQVLGIKRQQQELKQLGEDGETAFLRIQRSIEDGVVDTLTDVISGVKTLKEGLKDLLSSILKTISRIAAEEITDALFNRNPRNADDTTKKSGLSGVIDKIFGRNKTDADKQAQAIKELKPSVDNTATAVGKFDVSTIPRLDEIIALLRQANTKQSEINESVKSQAGTGGGLGGVIGAVGGAVGGLLSRKGGDGLSGVNQTVRDLDLEGNPIGDPQSFTDTFKNGFKDVFGTIKGVFDGFVGKLGGIFKEGAGLFGGIFKGIGGLFSGGLGGAASGIGGFFSKAIGFIGSLFGGGFAGGGYTGPGFKYAPAGIVHRDEFVFPKQATNFWGVDALNAMAFGMVLPAFGSYADGGLVTDAIEPLATSKATEGGGRKRLTIVNATTPDDVFDAMNTPEGEETFFNILRRGRKRARTVLDL